MLIRADNGQKSLLFLLSINSSLLERHIWWCQIDHYCENKLFKIISLQQDNNATNTQRVTECHIG